MCMGADIPAAPPPPPPPQAAKQPSTAPLKRRNQQDSSGGMAIPEGSTMLTGVTGIEQAQINVGQSSLLGGGRT